MEQIKELTKRLIANSFKELMLQMPFEKITIKTITDHANVIRPTFYNHFHDKYELVEWIVKTEIIDKTQEAIKNGSARGVIRVLFSGFLEDKEYYQKAFEISGQNGFIDTLEKFFTEMFASVINEDVYDKGLFTKEQLAKYYASGVITLVRLEVYRAETVDIEEIIDMYRFLMVHTIFDFIDNKAEQRLHFGENVVAFYIFLNLYMD